MFFSICLHKTAQETLNEFLRNFILGSFTKVYWPIKVLATIKQQYSTTTCISMHISGVTCLNRAGWLYICIWEALSLYLTWNTVNSEGFWFLIVYLTTLSLALTI
jgi:hypothetical protein